MDLTNTILSTWPSITVGITTVVTKILQGLITTLIGLLQISKALLIPAIIAGILLDQANYDSLVLNQVWDQQYDYIVIGAGSAGSVMAARLSEDPTKTVLLLEAGGGENILTNIPFVAILMQKTPVDWAFQTIPQNKSCWQLQNRSSPWPRGKLMGGSSSINVMLYVRGNPEDYNEWASNGCTGWSWPEVFPYFIKMENNTDPTYVATGYHGVRGPVTVSSATDPRLASVAFRDSGPYVGYGIGDFNGPNQTMFANFPQRTIRDGERCSMAKAYLEPIVDRPNLDILALSYVRRILFNGTQAIGVEFDRLLTTNRVYARKEIILSAGAVNSPKILMLSGIGPAEDLNELNISVIADLPVGRNLQEHPAGMFVFTMNQSVDFNLPQILSPWNLLDYYINKNGSLASNFIEGVAFVKTQFANQSDYRPDIELHFVPACFTTDYGLFFKNIFGLTDQLYTQAYLPNLGKPCFAIAVTLLREQSRGWLKLSSTNPYDYPIINPNYFDVDQDLDALVEGAKIALAVAQSPPMQKYKATPIQNVIPGCEEFVTPNQPLYSDNYIRCVIQSATLSIWHPGGTCKMGAKNDSTAVVDPQLRVKGIQGLRVVDTSIMPKVVGGNTNNPTAMLAEKLSDWMKGIQITPFLPPMSPSFVNQLPNMPTQPYVEPPM